MIWEPQEGPQTYLSVLPDHIEDIFFGGGRGGGKTSAIGGMFQNHWFEYGKHARGLVIRKTYDEFEEIVDQFDELYCTYGAKRNKTQHFYMFPNGAKLKLKYMEREEDAAREKGKQYSFIAADECDDFSNPKGLDRLWGCLRSTHPGQRKLYIKTGNAGGTGHNWLKRRYVTPSPMGVPFLAEDEINGKIIKTWRIYIESKLHHNRILSEADPDYRERLYQTGPDWLVKAWLNCDWDIVAGGAIDDLWSPKKHIIDPFKIPDNWLRTRSFDWGSSSPFSVLWFAHSNGEKTEYGTIPRGTAIVTDEWYGGKGNNEGLRMHSADIAKGIVNRENGIKVKPGAADNSIYDVEDEHSVADTMEREGIKWKRADKRKGSRKMRLEQLRLRLKNSLGNEGPGLLIFSNCRKLIEHLPVLKRDPKNFAEDIDTEQEDHDYDALTYELNRTVRKPITFSDLPWK